MDEPQPRITGLLERAAGPVGRPPIETLVAGGRRRLRNRRIAQALTTSAAVVAALGTVLPLTLTPGAGRGSTATVTESPSSTASQLAHGSWQRIPDAPFNRCSDEAYTSTIGGIALVQPKTASCRPAAGLYDARTNTWRSVASPPSFLAPQQALVWSGTDLLALPAAGQQPYVWSGAANMWRPLPSLPHGFGVPTGAIWWHRSWLVVSAAGHLAQSKGQSWRQFAALPTPPGYHADQPAVALIGGHLLASAVDVEVKHHGRQTSEHFRPLVFMWAGNRWQTVAAGSGLPAVPTQLLPLGTGILVVGSNCPAGGYCPVSSEIRVVRVIGRADKAGDFSPPAPLASLAVAPTGATLASVSPNHRFGTQLYDATSHTWAIGPRLRLTRHEASYGDSGVLWTDAGIATLVVPADQLRYPGKDHRATGYILKPAR